MSRNITPEELQKAYNLAFTLHPREDVALRVTMDACDFLRQLESNQARRTRSARHWKVAIPQEQLLQYAVYMVSYERELDQESHRPRFTPIYQPTREDRIVRYVKHLVFRTYLLSARSIAVGIGCLLYAYKPSEIADLLFLSDVQLLRTIKMRLAQDLRRRFANSGVVSLDGKSMRTIPASDNDQLIIEAALKAFTPWGTDHLEIPAPDRLMLEMLIDEENPVAEWQCKHALIDPECMGFVQLINEYNDNYSSTPNRQRLADPRSNLMLPDFGGGPDPSLQRFKPRLLSDSEKMFLNERRKPSGPWAYLAEVLLFLSEFGAMEDCLTDWLIPMYFCDEDDLTRGIHNSEHDHGEARIGYGPYCIEIQETNRQATTMIFHAPISLDCAVRVVACVGTGQHCAASLAKFVGADDMEDSESGFLRLVGVFQEFDFPMTRHSASWVSRPYFAFDLDIGVTVDPSGSFANEKQAQRNYGKILVYDVIWTSETSATIHARLLDLKQLLLLIRYQASESSSGSNFFHISGYGCASPPEAPCAAGSDCEQGFLRNGIDGAICVWETMHERSQTQRQQPTHEVLLRGNAQKKLPNFYGKVAAPFLNQSRPTQLFTF